MVSNKLIEKKRAIVTLSKNLKYRSIRLQSICEHKLQLFEKSYS